jgi:hypothetical protein
MKKYIYLSILLLGVISFNSCEKFEPGGTAVQDMAGDWWVTNQQSVDEYDYIFGGQGEMPDEADIENWEWDYIYDDTHTMVYTYNTASNTSDTVFVSDGGLFWNYKVKAIANYKAKTFELPSGENLAYDGCDVTIIKGKILKGAATSPSGTPVDSIVYYIKFSDDGYGFTYTKVSGFRKTGFPEDDF